MFCLYTFPLARPVQAKIQNLTAILCIVKLIPWNVVNVYVQNLNKSRSFEEMDGELHKTACNENTKRGFQRLVHTSNRLKIFSYIVWTMYLYIIVQKGFQSFYKKIFGLCPLLTKGNIKPKADSPKKRTNEFVLFAFHSKQNKFVGSIFGRIYGAPILLSVLSDL